MFSSRASIVTLQRNDHARLEQLLRSYETGSGQLERTYAGIVELVSTHAFAEETVLFPAARRLLPTSDGLTGDIEQKHQRVNDLMLEMEAWAPGATEFELRTRELFTLLRADAREEEDQLLTALAAVTNEGQLRAIGAAWAAVRRAAPSRPHPRISRRPPGNFLAGPPLAIYDRLRKAWERLHTSMRASGGSAALKRKYADLAAAVRPQDGREANPRSPEPRVESAERAARLLIEKPVAIQLAEQGQASEQWDIVDEASWESFPASDPPAYIAGRARTESRAPSGQQPARKENREADEEPVAAVVPELVQHARS